MLLMIGSCHRGGIEDYSKLPDAFDSYLEKSAATSVFMSKTRGFDTQIVFARGETTEAMFIPQDVDPEAATLIDTIKNNKNCVVSSADRLKAPVYQDVADELGIAYLILCPIDESYFLGMGFNEVPELGELELSRKLTEFTDESL